MSEINKATVQRLAECLPYEEKQEAEKKLADVKDTDEASLYSLYRKYAKRVRVQSKEANIRDVK